MVSHLKDYSRRRSLLHIRILSKVVPRYQYLDGKSQKFWAIERSGTDIVLCWGRIGRKGQSKRKSFDTPAEANDY